MTDTKTATDPNAPPPGKAELDATERSAHAYVFLLGQKGINSSHSGKELHELLQHVDPETWEKCRAEAEAMDKHGQELAQVKELSKMQTQFTTLKQVTSEMLLATVALKDVSEHLHNPEAEGKHDEARATIEAYINLIETFLKFEETFFRDFENGIKQATTSSSTTGGSVNKKDAANTKPLTSTDQTAVAAKQKAVDNAKNDVAIHANVTPMSPDEIARKKTDIDRQIIAIDDQESGLDQADATRRIERKAEITLTIDREIKPKLNDLAQKRQQADRLPADRKDRVFADLDQKKADLEAMQDPLLAELQTLDAPNQAWIDSQRQALKDKQGQLRSQKEQVGASGSADSLAAKKKQVEDDLAKLQKDLETFEKETVEKNVQRINDLTEKLEKGEEIADEDHKFLIEMHHAGHIEYDHEDVA
jgi:hypothetical protein